MINVIIKKKKIRAHKHKNTLEIYKIIKGKLNVKFFRNNEKFYKECLLENNKTEFCKVIPNTFHITNPVGRACVFVETRSGPFKKKDTKFSKNFFTSNNMFFEKYTKIALKILSQDLKRKYINVIFLNLLNVFLDILSLIAIYPLATSLVGQSNTSLDIMIDDFFFNLI